MLFECYLFVLSMTWKDSSVEGKDYPTWEVAYVHRFNCLALFDGHMRQIEFRDCVSGI